MPTDINNKMGNLLKDKINAINAILPIKKISHYLNGEYENTYFSNFLIQSYNSDNPNTFYMLPAVFDASGLISNYDNVLIGKNIVVGKFGYGSFKSIFSDTQLAIPSLIDLTPAIVNGLIEKQINIVHLMTKFQVQLKHMLEEMRQFHHQQIMLLLKKAFMV